MPATLLYVPLASTVCLSVLHAFPVIASRGRMRLSVLSFFVAAVFRLEALERTNRDRETASYSFLRPVYRPTDRPTNCDLRAPASSAPPPLPPPRLRS